MNKMINKSQEMIVRIIEIRPAIVVFFSMIVVFIHRDAVAMQSNSADTLYNGIILPAVWPPQNLDPASTAPMPVPYLEAPPSVIPINVGRQLFVDDFLVQETTLKRVFHQAKKHPENPVFKPETTHEIKPEFTTEPGQRDVVYLGHGGVFYDPEDRRFKMFYTAGWRGGLALAVSDNLLDWERPRIRQSDSSNIILPPGKLWSGGDNSVWLDVNATDKRQRFKYLTDRTTYPLGYANKNFQQHTLHVSGDGIVWSQGINTGRSEDYCSFFYNPFRKVWCFSIKPTFPIRVRHYLESREFLKPGDWETSTFWVRADSLDLPDPLIGDKAQLYSLNAVAYESIMIGEFYIHLGPDNQKASAGKFPKLTEIKLGYSRDGFHWDRPGRRAFIEATRKEGDWDRAYLHGTTGVFLVMGDELWFPYNGYSGIAADGTRGMYTGASVGIATLRRDGFASMEAGEKTGHLLTRPLTFTGKYLFVNVDCPDGELLVEVLDMDGNVIRPFSLKKCKSVKFDKTLHQIEWEGQPNLSALAGQPVRFRFHLTNGKLYSFWVSPDLNGASYGYLAAGSPGHESVLDTKGSDAR